MTYKFDMISINAGVIPTTYGTGPFHPAMRVGAVVTYWPNVTYPTEDEAYAWAKTALEQVMFVPLRDMNAWNIWSINN